MFATTHLLVQAFGRAILEQERVSIFLDDVNTFLEAVQQSFIATSWDFSLYVDVAEDFGEDVDADDCCPEETCEGQALNDRFL